MISELTSRIVPKKGSSLFARVTSPDEPPSGPPSSMQMDTNTPSEPAEPRRAQPPRRPPGCLEQVMAVMILNLKTALLPPSGTERADECLQELQSKIAVLANNAEDLESKIIQVGKEILKAKNAKDLNRAKSKLRDRRRLEAQLERVTQALDVIASQESVIQAADMDRSILEALERSNDAIKRVGLTQDSADRANAVIDELEQHFDRSAEIQDQMAPLSRMQFGEVEVDESALEDEFRLLEEEQGLDGSYIPVLDVQRKAHEAKMEQRRAEAEAEAAAAPAPRVDTGVMTDRDPDMTAAELVDIPLTVSRAQSQATSEAAATEGFV